MTISLKDTEYIKGNFRKLSAALNNNFNFLIQNVVCPELFITVPNRDGRFNDDDNDDFGEDIYDRDMKVIVSLSINQSTSFI